MSGLTIIGHDGPSPGQMNRVIRGMRNSWESHEKSDSGFSPADEYWSEIFKLGPADRALALRLACLGADHGKYLRQLPVIVDIKAPGYWWREFDTYRVGVTDSEPTDDGSDVTMNSTSMMHILGKEPVTIQHFYFDTPESQSAFDCVQIVNDARLAWIEAGKRKGPQAEAWRHLQQVVPYAWLYTRTISLNYQVLRSIYHARKHHRLAEWRDFTVWCETLDNSDLITTEKAQ